MAYDPEDESLAGITELDSLPEFAGHVSSGSGGLGCLQRNAGCCHGRLVYLRNGLGNAAREALTSPD